jgi:gentisate 1,2-dioxygenase
VIVFMNPGLGGKWAATSTLWAGVQILLPGETTPAYRHSPAAIRFIIQGQGAYTTVEGDQCFMAPGDLVLTPPWTWHDHGNDSDDPVLWMDGLDLPFVRDMDAGFFEPFTSEQQPLTKPANDSERRYGIGQLRPTWEHPASTSSPLLNYKWEQTEEALRRLATSGVSPYDDVALEYINPHTGGPVLPTMACWVQLIRPRVHTRAHRQTNSAVYHVFRGEGYTVINGERFAWKTGDFLSSRRGPGMSMRMIPPRAPFCSRCKIPPSSMLSACTANRNARRTAVINPSRAHFTHKCRGAIYSVRSG